VATGQQLCVGSGPTRRDATANTCGPGSWVGRGQGSRGQDGARRRGANKCGPRSRTRLSGVTKHVRHSAQQLFRGALSAQNRSSAVSPRSAPAQKQKQMPVAAPEAAIRNGNARRRSGMIICYHCSLRRRQLLDYRRSRRGGPEDRAAATARTTCTTRTTRGDSALEADRSQRAAPAVTSGERRAV
jgi:hypothetical protein